MWYSTPAQTDCAHTKTLVRHTMPELHPVPPNPWSRDDSAMMADVSRWPHRWALPIKRYQGNSDDATMPRRLQVGVLLNVQGLRRYFVFLSYLFDPALEDEFSGQPSSLPRIEYHSYADIVNDGWVVD